MEANLRGLDVRSKHVTPAAQPVGEGVTEWRWEVEPTATGQRQLHLTLTALFYIPDKGSGSGHRTRYAVRTFERTLNVKGVPVALHTRVGDFVSGNWQWLVMAHASPLVAWGAHRRRRSQRGHSVADKARPHPWL